MGTNSLCIYLQTDTPQGILQPAVYSFKSFVYNTAGADPEIEEGGAYIIEWGLVQRASLIPWPSRIRRLQYVASNTSLAIRRSKA